VTEQRGIPFVVNIAAAPQVTEQGLPLHLPQLPALDLTW